MIFRASGIIVACMFASGVFADNCSDYPRFSSSEEYLEPLSVPAARIGDYLSDSEWSEGIKFTSDKRGDQLWLDVTRYPGTTTAIGALRAVMQVGRVADEDFKTLVLSDGRQGVFEINEADLRPIGCRFIWGREGGENPIALMRELFQSIRYYDTDRPLSDRFTGSLMGDTTLAATLNNELLMPEWAMSALE